MTTFTHPRLAEIAAYLATVRANLAEVVAATPPARLSAPGTNDQWNAAQILQHLGKVEGSTAKYLEGILAAALAGGIAADANTTSLLDVLDRFKDGGEVWPKLIAPDRLRPDPAPDAAACWVSLQMARERVLRVYATVDGRDLTAITAPHPRLGTLNAYEWFLFLGKHEERHLDQLRRAVAT